MPRWRPDASLATLKARAELCGSVRAFFMARGVLEVETPILSAHATVDRFIESFSTVDGRWLQTSPEFAMKRLLAAGSGPIFQIARVFRLEEQGRHHNPEFTMLEWYRPGFSMQQLMDEVEALMRALVGGAGGFQRLSYRDAFLRHAGFDPHSADATQMRAAAMAAELISAADFANEPAGFWLDLWMSRVVSPALGAAQPAFVYDFPASQAALAQVRQGPPPVAERFELFWRGIELANGFHELADAKEQRGRFEADQRYRCAAEQVVPPYDAHLIAALEAGLPDCSGVALGLDRVLMLKLGLSDLAQTLAFAADRA
ncbi:MAG: genX [Hydrocarboniphaga sp.]|uniref:EF-P lysine aminoacylase EpmA n=1 Tax=Hydrocarboniphaga sp. TaxID=2033016 RepID=UPI00260946DF|nr:EF-P lysine aminoacylase EpmA [Hydrocarboniphaga sp.]MDB5967637.1 genX [Hydrocarboniphaga sp.]